MNVRTSLNFAQTAERVRVVTAAQLVPIAAQPALNAAIYGNVQTALNAPIVLPFVRVVRIFVTIAPTVGVRVAESAETAAATQFVPVAARPALNAKALHNAKIAVCAQIVRQYAVIAVKCAVTVRQAGAKAVRPAANATTIQPARSAAKPAWNADQYINV